jgi:hypothetical protein
MHTPSQLCSTSEHIRTRAHTHTHHDVRVACVQRLPSQQLGRLQVRWGLLLGPDHAPPVRVLPTSLAKLTRRHGELAILCVRAPTREHHTDGARPPTMRAQPPRVKSSQSSTHERSVAIQPNAHDLLFMTGMRDTQERQRAHTTGPHGRPEIERRPPQAHSHAHRPASASTQRHTHTLLILTGRFCVSCCPCARHGTVCACSPATAALALTAVYRTFSPGSTATTCSGRSWGWDDETGPNCE